MVYIMKNPVYDSMVKIEGFHAIEDREKRFLIQRFNGKNN